MSTILVIDIYTSIWVSDLSFSRNLHTFLAEERVRMRTSAFIPTNRDFKFLPLYGSSDVCRREVAPRVSTRAEKPFREIRIVRRGTEPLSSRTLLMVLQGIRLHSGIRLSSIKNSHATCTRGKYHRADSFTCGSVGKLPS